MSNRSYAFRGTDAKIRANINKGQNSVLVARCRRLRITVNRNLARFFEVGVQTATEIFEGNIEIDGVLEKSIWDGRMIKACIGSNLRTSEENFKNELSSDGESHTPFQLEFEISFEMRFNAQGDQAVKATMKGVKINRWDLNLPQNDWIMETITFMAKNISIESSFDTTDVPPQS